MVTWREPARLQQPRSVSDSGISIAMPSPLSSHAGTPHLAGDANFLLRQLYRLSAYGMKERQQGSRSGLCSRLHIFLSDHAVPTPA